MAGLDHANKHSGPDSQSQSFPEDDVPAEEVPAPIFPAGLKNRRILLITESLGPVNGVSRTTLSLIEYLRANGVQVCVVAPQYPKQTEPGLLRPNGNAGPGPPNELRLPGYALPYNPDLTVVYPFKIVDILQRTSPELIYLASPASAGFQVLLQLRHLPNPPPVLLNFQTDLSAYSEILFPGPVSRFSVWLLKVVQGYLFSHHCVHTIFYPSSGIRRYLRGAGVEDDKLVQLGRGVDTELFNPARRDHVYRKNKLAPNGEIVLVTVCRLAPEKGFDFLARVAIRLAEQKKVPFKLLVVGGNLNPVVENEIHRLFEPVRDHVVFTGFLTGLDLARAYASSDLFLHCSVTETFGLVVLEAMASGLPVIARDQGGPSDIIRDQETGYLVPSDDLDGFGSLVQRSSSDERLRSSMATAARTFACENTWEGINRKVAWHMAVGLQKHAEAAKTLTGGDGLVSTYSLMVLRLRLHLAHALVYLVWAMAATVLLLFGHDVFSKSRHLLTSLRRRLT